MLRNPFTSLEPYAYPLLRVISGFMFSIHGAQKIFGVLGGHVATGTQMWIGGLIELVCGVLIAVGLVTPWAAFLASGTMAVAYAQFHWKFQFDEGFFPAKNKGELSALYAVVFFFIAAHGSGGASLDSLLAKRANKTKPA